MEKLLLIMTIVLAANATSFGGSDLFGWANLLLVPISSAITWYVTWRTTKTKRNNDAIATLQETVNNVLTENAKLYKEITENRAEIAKVRQENAGLKAQLDEVLKVNQKYEKELSGLRTEFKKMHKQK